jgi:hypothetical protein
MALSSLQGIRWGLPCLPAFILSVLQPKAPGVDVGVQVFEKLKCQLMYLGSFYSSTEKTDECYGADGHY